MDLTPIQSKIHTIGGSEELSRSQIVTLNNTQFCEIYQALIELSEQKKGLDKPRKTIGFYKNET